MSLYFQPAEGATQSSVGKKEVNMSFVQNVKNHNKQGNINQFIEFCSSAIRNKL